MARARSVPLRKIRRRNRGSESARRHRFNPGQAEHHVATGTAERSDELSPKDRVDERKLRRDRLGPQGNRV
jgi:hypothetical protein